MLFVGPVDQGVSFAVAKEVRDAGGTVVRTRSISVPLDAKAIQDGAPRPSPRSAATSGADHITELGDALWRRSSTVVARRHSGTRSAKIIVQEREGSATPPADAVVVVRSAEPQRGLTKAFLAGVYGGPRAIGRAGRRHRGARARPRAPSPRSRSAGLSTVDSVDTSAGRLGLVLLLGGARAGQLRRRGDGRRRRAAVDPSGPAAGVTRPAAERPADGPRRGARRGEQDRRRPSRRSARSSPRR